MQTSHKVWIASNGAGPWPCFRCDGLVLSLGGHRGRRPPDFGVIHHDDRRHGNNELNNLRILHDRCHLELHDHAKSTVIAASLRVRIEAGEFTFLLPSYAKLAKEYGSSVDTALRAMHQLRDEGLLVPLRGGHTGLCIPQHWHKR